VRQGIEDVLPLWLANKLAHNAREHHPDAEATYVNYSYTSFGAMQNDDATGSAAAVRQKTGAIPAAYKLPKVCTDCNNGWMSRMEGAVKLLIPGILEGRPKRLTPYDQLVLATWATKTSLTYDASRIPRHISAEAGTRRMFRLGFPLPGTQVVLCDDSNATTPQGCFAHARQPFSPEGQPEPMLVKVGFQFERLILQTTIALSGNVEVAPTRSTHCRQIWPLSGDAFTWPPDATPNEGPDNPEEVGK